MTDFDPRDPARTGAGDEPPAAGSTDPADAPTRPIAGWQPSGQWQHPGWTTPQAHDTTVFPTDVIFDSRRGDEHRPRRSMAERLHLTGIPRMLLVAVAIAALVGGVVGAALAVLATGGTSSDNGNQALGALSAPPAQRQNARPPGSVAAVAAEVLPSVVSVNVQSGTSGDTGSGVVLSRDGYVLTNNHVISSAADGQGQITVQLYNRPGQDVPARIIGRDPQSDLAVIKVQGVDDLKPARLGNSSGLVVGDPVIAVGSPLGLAGTVTSGIISAKDRPVRASGEGTDTDAVIDALQTDAAINPGNSGGPLVSADDGSVVGINSAIATLGSDSIFGGGGQSGSIGLGFAIPIDYARSIAEELIKTGKASHPVIGVQANTLTDSQSAQIAGSKPGAYVDVVVKGSPADRAGLQPGDIIVAVNGTRVTSVDELIVETRKHKVGDSVQVTYLRGGTQHTVTMTLASDDKVG